MIVTSQTYSVAEAWQTDAQLRTTAESHSPDFVGDDIAIRAKNEFTELDTSVEAFL